MIEVKERPRARSDSMALPIRKIGVIGAGQMGSGIAHVTALAGIEVKLNDLSVDRIKAGIATINGNMARQVSRKRITEEERQAALKRITPLEKSAGGIIIPDTVQEKPMEGEVIAAGPGARNELGAIVSLDVKAGDRVLFGKWSGTEVKLDGEDLLIMKETDLLGVIEGAPALAKAG